MSESLIPKHGGYRDLKSFQNAAIVYEELGTGTRFREASGHLGSFRPPLWTSLQPTADSLQPPTAHQGQGRFQIVDCRLRRLPCHKLQAVSRCP
jgi:hypothetical protein